MWIDNLITWIRDRWFKVETPAHDSMVNMLVSVRDQLQEVKEELQYDKDILLKEIKKKDAILHAMIEMMPDMVWCKDKEGRYIYANKAIREGLLFDDNPIGKNDIELALAAKKRFGADKHTFGEVCGNSDLVVLGNRSKGQRFMESGLVKGENLDLEVHKAIVELEGDIIGVVGSGRDMTEYRRELLKRNCKGCPISEDIFKKWEYINNDKGEQNG